MKRNELTISNALMFAEIMRDEDICREVVNRIIPERRVKEIKYSDDNNDLFAYIHSEDVVIPEIRARSIRIDVRFEDDDSWYAIEMQIADEKNLPKRCRYIHSAMDVSHLDRGNDVNNLKAGYVIFICCFDYFKRGKTKYFFQSYDVENDLFLGDERYTIILNTRDINEYVSKELATLLEYFDSGNVEATDDFITSLDELVTSVAQSRVGDRIMTLQDLIDASERRAAVMIEEAEKIKAEGEKAKAEGEKAKAEGEKAKAEGEKAKAEGEKAKAEGEKAKAEGEKAKAEGEKAKAEGEAMIREAKEKLKAAEKIENSIVFNLYSERLIPAEKAAEKLGILVEEFIRLYEENSDKE